jgi:signal transduction histidine kinase
MTDLPRRRFVHGAAAAGLLAVTVGLVLSLRDSGNGRASSAWFFLTCGVALASLALVAVSLRTARMRTRAVLFAERSRMARELHDTVLQGLAGISLQVSAIRGRLSDAPDQVGRDLDEIDGTVTDCLNEARRVVWELREPHDRGGDLARALVRLARRLSPSSRPSCLVAIEGAARPLPRVVEDELYRVAEEALRNALAHARAGRIVTLLQFDGDVVTLTVSDDGRGFDLDSQEAAARSTGHFGLLGMRERAARLCAVLTVRSEPGHGTVIEAAVPIPRQRDGC